MGHVSRNKESRTANPTARSGWWGFLRLPGAVPLLAGALLAAGLTGCAGTVPPVPSGQGKAGSAAPADSLGLEEFLALAPEVRQERRDQAGIWMARSHRERSPEGRVAALTRAAGLAPDDPDIWLQLARRWRWVGDHLMTGACLDNAAAAVRALGRSSSDLAGRTGDYRREAALSTGILRAWLHYDRAEYHEGLKWARAAAQLEPGNALTWQVQGLLEASLGHRSQAQEIAGDFRRAKGFDTNIAWILATLERSWGRYRESFNYFLNLRPNEDHAAECWRDMGLAAERVGEWSYARRWYRESAAALPMEDTSGLVEIEHDRLDFRLQAQQQPVWMAGGIHYVTGSRSAYTAYALERFEQATDTRARDTWGGLVVNAAGICLRMDQDKPWALRARGIVFARTGKAARGLEDLKRAAEGLAELGLADGRVEAEIGHLLLLDKRQASAILHLRRAVELEPDNAGAWSDLGLALIMTDDREGAERALTRSLTLDPLSATAWYNRGLMNMHRGDFAQAEADLIRAAELAPENQDVARLLQQVARRQREAR